MSFFLSPGNETEVLPTSETVLRNSSLFKEQEQNKFPQNENFLENRNLVLKQESIDQPEVIKIEETKHNTKNKNINDNNLLNSNETLDEKHNKVNKNTIVLKHDPQVFQQKNNESHQKSAFKLNHKLDKLEELAPMKKVKLDNVNSKTISPNQEI